MNHPRTLLPTGSTALERAVDATSQRWEGLSFAVYPANGEPPEAFKPWLAAEWALADFARYFGGVDELLAAGLPWLFERGTAAGVKRALAWIDFPNARIDEDGAWLHIDLGRAATNEELGRIAHLVRATVPAHVYFYRVYWAWDLRPLRLDARPGLDGGILDNESGVMIELDGQDPIKASFGSRHASSAGRPGPEQLLLGLTARTEGRLDRRDVLRLDSWWLDSSLHVDALGGAVTHYPSVAPELGLGAGEALTMPLLYLPSPERVVPEPETLSTSVVRLAAPNFTPVTRGWEGSWDDQSWAASNILSNVATEHDVLALFANGRQGWHYSMHYAFKRNVAVGFDPARCMLFQDETLAIPVTGVEQYVAYIKDFSPRGNHLYAPGGTTKRGLLSARVNQLSATESATTYQGNDGTSTFFVVVGDVPPGLQAPSVSKCTKAVGRVGNWYRYGTGAAVVVTPNAINTRSFFFKPLLNCASVAGSTSSGDKFYFHYNFETGVMTVGVNAASATAEQVGNGWWRFKVTQKAVDANTSHLFAIVAWPKVASDPGEFLSTGYDSRLAIDSHLPYQRVNTATDYDTAGFPHYLSTDGMNNAMRSVGPVDLSGTDKVTVVTGVTKLSDTTTASLIYFGDYIGNLNGSFAVQAPTNGGTAQIGFFTRGTSTTAANAAGFPAPTSRIVIGIGDISGDLSRLVVNGVQAAQSTADQGAGNYGNHIAYHFARAGSSLFFKGRWYGETVVGGLLTANELTKLESWHNRHIKAY